MSSMNMDWNDLASSQLPSLSGDGDSWTRSLPQLATASESLWQQQQPRPGQSMLGASSSLNWNTNRDPSSVMDGPQSSTDHPSSYNGTNVTMPSSRGAGRPFESLEDMIARQEDEIIQGILERTAEDTRRKTEAMVEKKLQEGWERERNIWIQELVGSRRLGGAFGNTRGTNPLQQSGDRQSGQLMRLDDSSPNSQTLVGFPSSSSTGPKQTFPEQPLDIAMAQEHCNILRQYMPATLNYQQTRPLASIIEKLSNVVSDTIDRRRNQRPFHSRQSQVRLNEAAQRSYESSLQFLTELANADSTVASVDQARAALTHLCKQFQVHVTNTVRQAQLSGQEAGSQQDTYKTGLANQCSTFTKLELGLIDQQKQPWTVVYYCLRCGDAAAAAEVMQSHQPVAGASDGAVQRILNAMAQVQGDAGCIWEVPAPRLSQDDLTAVDNLLESARHLESPSIHQIGVYSLLSSTGQPVTSETVVGFRTIEDYLTVSLWKALIQGNPVEELVKFGKLISEELGQDYFADPSSGGWSFALPLLLTQQYCKALTYLADAGGAMGLLHATHIGLLLSGAGVAVHDLGHTDPLKSDGDILSSLLVAYSNLLISDPQNLGSLAATEYLVRIPVRKRAQKEVAKLIAKTAEIEKLVGVLNAEGMRQNSFIAEYFNSTELSFILDEAARSLSENKNDNALIGSAMMCLMLGERYGDVLTMLNELISPPNKPDASRQFWIEQSKSFRAVYLEQRTHVSEVLEQTGKKTLIETNTILLELNMFEQLRASQKFSDAWNLAEKLDLLPSTQSDLPAKQAMFRDLNPLVKNAYPSFLVGVMEIYHMNHSNLKQQLHGDNTGVVRERLKELRQKASLLGTMASSVGLASEHIVPLTTMASLMI